MSGELPNSISQLSKIQQFDIRYNNFSGQLPDITTMTSIKTMLVSHNNFAGLVPESFGVNTTLTDVDIHANIGLTGITEEIFISNTSLRYLDVRHTQMTQTKPNLPSLDASFGGFFGFDLLNADETNLLDFVTQEILDDSHAKVGNIVNVIAKADYKVYIDKAQAMLNAKTAVETLLVAPEYTALEEDASYELLEEASDLVTLVVEGELKDELRNKLVMIVDMLDATLEID